MCINTIITNKSDKFYIFGLTYMDANKANLVVCAKKLFWKLYLLLVKKLLFLLSCFQSVKLARTVQIRYIIVIILNIEYYEERK